MLEKAEAERKVWKLQIRLGVIFFMYMVVMAYLALYFFTKEFQPNRILIFYVMLGLQSMCAIPALYGAFDPDGPSSITFWVLGLVVLFLTPLAIFREVIDVLLQDLFWKLNMLYQLFSE